LARVLYRRLLLNGNAVDDLATAFHESMSSLDTLIKVQQVLPHFVEGIRAFDFGFWPCPEFIVSGRRERLDEVAKAPNRVLVGHGVSFSGESTRHC
jgi:hypothetical protein